MSDEKRFTEALRKILRVTKHEIEEEEQKHRNEQREQTDQRKSA